MKTPDEIADAVTGCIICGRNPIAAAGYFIPVSDAAYAAVVRLRERALLDGHTPTICYGLCRKHARRMERSALQVEARILAAAAEVTVQ